MALYIARDVACNFSGDVTIGANGDLKLADSYESHKAAVNFLIRTDKGEYKADRRVGCDLGTFIGQEHDEAMHIAMEHSILDNITRFVISRSDVQAHVMPLSYDQAGVFLVVGGTYVDSDGNTLDLEPEVLVYAFPYAEGEPRLVGVQQ